MELTAGKFYNLQVTGEPNETMKESACREERGPTNLVVESLAFSEIPGQSKLFLDYQSDPNSLSTFYPNVVSSITTLLNHAAEVLRNYPDHRGDVCDVLLQQNRRFGASQKTLENIERLRQGDCVAVLTGQQAGILGGPLYTVHKALTVIKAAEELTKNGTPAVPIFWAATEDHDFAEIAEAFNIDASGRLVDLVIKGDPQNESKPVGSIVISYDDAEAIAEHLESLSSTEFTDSTKEMFRDCWKAGSTYGLAFCSFIAKIFASYGLIVVDPMSPKLKEISAPLIVSAINEQKTTAVSLLQRDAELLTAGYHSQVVIDQESVPLFWINDAGERRALKATHDGQFRINGEREMISSEWLIEKVAAEPERFSPGVMLRPVVQDYLFPTICYFGGGAEIAYFAQNSEVYRVLGRPSTPIFHRQSFTIVEAKHGRTLNKFELEFKDLFQGFDALLPLIIERFINPSAAESFAETEETINSELGKLAAELNKIDPTLAANLATRQRKIAYHIAALQKKFHRVQGERDETVDRQLRTAFAELFPRSGLQERSVGLATYFGRHGNYCIDWLYEAIDLNDKGHRIIYL